jgi:endoglucanase
MNQNFFNKTVKKTAVKITILFLAIFFLPGKPQRLSAQAPFHRGVCIGEWFQADNAKAIDFSKYKKQDFINIKSLGCDVIRLPISMHSFIGGAPGYKFDPLYFVYLDAVITWAEQLKLYLVLDNHSFDAAISAGPVLRQVWGQMAQRCKNRSKYILYEILNEAHDLPTKDWAVIQQSVIDVIRKTDTRHTIIAGPSSYNHYTELKNFPVFADTNILYTFHFYDPFIFTHQGADWVGLQTFKGVPFPYDVARMPERNAAQKGTWGDSLLSVYNADGNAQKIRSLIDMAINFKTTNHVNIYCGEFGANIPNTAKQDRVLWHKAVREYLDEKGIPWTLWDYHGGFGVFTKDKDGQFDYDLNIPLLEALGLKVPL